MSKQKRCDRKRPKKRIVVHERASEGIKIRITNDNGVYEIEMIEEGLISQTRVCFDITKAIKVGNEMLREEIQKRRIDTLPL